MRKYNSSDDIVDKTFILDSTVAEIFADLAEENRSSMSILLCGELREERLLIEREHAELIAIPLPDRYEETTEITLALGYDGENDLQFIAKNYGISEEKVIALLVYHLDKLIHYFADGKRQACHRKKCRAKEKKHLNVPVYQ